MATMASEKMDNNPTSASPIAQSMNFNHHSSTRFSGTSPPTGSPAPDATYRRTSSSASNPSRQLDLQGQSQSRIEECRQLFHLPPDEEPKSDISTQKNGSIIEKSGGSRQSLDELDITKRHFLSAMNCHSTSFK